MPKLCSRQISPQWRSTAILRHEFSAHNRSHREVIQLAGGYSNALVAVTMRHQTAPLSMARASTRADIWHGPVCISHFPQIEFRIVELAHACNDLASTKPYSFACTRDFGSVQVPHWTGAAAGVGDGVTCSCAYRQHKKKPHRSRSWQPSLCVMSHGASSQRALPTFL